MTKHPHPAPPPLSASARRFPVLALASSGILLLAVAAGAQPSDAGGSRFPLLALLGLCELGVIINLVSAYLALRAAQARAFRLAALLPFTFSLIAAGVFLWLGVWFWPL